jgi:hypothetical protein
VSDVPGPLSRDLEPPAVAVPGTLVAAHLGPYVRGRVGAATELLMESASGRLVYFLDSVWRFTILGAAIALPGSLLVPPVLPWGAVVCGVVGGGMASLLLYGGRALRRWRLRRVPLIEDPRTTPSGTAARLRGTVEPARASFQAPGSGQEVVFARTLFWQAREQGRARLIAREDVRGLPFDLRLPNGTAVRIEPSSLQLISRARQVRGVPEQVRRALGASLRGRLFGREALFRQAVIAPGDTIEVVGQLVSHVSPAGEAAPGRGTPVVYELAPGRDLRIWVRTRARA